MAFDSSTGERTPKLDLCHTDNGFSIMVQKRKAETLGDIKIKEGDPNGKRRKY
jgi:hypothetical protein